MAQTYLKVFTIGPSSEVRSVEALYLKDFIMQTNHWVVSGFLKNLTFLRMQCNEKLYFCEAKDIRNFIFQSNQP